MRVTACWEERKESILLRISLLKSVILFWMVYREGGCQWREKHKLRRNSLSNILRDTPVEQMKPVAKKVK